MPAHLTPLVSEMFDRIGRHMTGLPRVTFANLWLFRAAIVRRLEGAPQTNAMVRTTTAPTMLEGSPKDNVLPQRARAVVNFRLLPGDRIASVLDYVQRTVGDTRVVIRAVGPGSEPSPVSPTNGVAFATLERTIHEVVPGAITTPYLLVGGTDSRHYAPIATNIFRASAMGIRGNDLERIHGTNERSAVADLRRNVQFYVRLIQAVQSM
jgi:carboxypeptidase PM20D1